MRSKRVLLANVVLSLGTPMLLAGDELGHTQLGNNNAYCQDNVTTWLNWDGMDEDLFQYTKQLIALRGECVVLQSQFWWSTTANGTGTVARWCNSSGGAIAEEDWTNTGVPEFMLILEQGALWLLLFNGGDRRVEFILPPGTWTRRLDTSEPSFLSQSFTNTVTLEARSLWLFESSNNSNSHRS
jgi:glycogen operon protein